MQKFVAEQNLAHLRELLGRTQDPERREMLERLIREEEAKLGAMLHKD